MKFRDMFFYNKDKKGLSPAQISWKKFRSSKIAMLSLTWIAINVIIAFLGYLITPDSTPFANNQQLEVRTKSPGTKVSTLKVKKNIPQQSCTFFGKMFFGCESTTNSFPINSWEFVYDEIVVSSYTGTDDIPGIEKSFNIADVVYSIDTGKEVVIKTDSLYFSLYNNQIQVAHIDEVIRTIKAEHIVDQYFLLGTDQFGRDMLSQLIIGTRVSLSVGFIAVLISLLIGVTLGSIGGFFRGKIDDFIIWLINIIWSVPTLILVIAITFAIGKGFWQVFIAVGLTMWVDVARVTRGQIISIREKEFVEAARALGINTFRIITRHILPNIYGPLIVISAANFASAILIEAGLSFLGMGVQPPIPSWGIMIKENYGYIILDKAYMAILPGVAIMLMVLSFLMAGNSLRDALDKTFVN
jgi:peptide/nickel transport system permease protein